MFNCCGLLTRARFGHETESIDRTDTYKDEILVSHNHKRQEKLGYRLQNDAQCVMRTTGSQLCQTFAALSFVAYEAQFLVKVFYVAFNNKGNSSSFAIF